MVVPAGRVGVQLTIVLLRLLPPRAQVKVLQQQLVHGIIGGCTSFLYPMGPLGAGSIRQWRELSKQSVTRATCTISVTSWTRTICAPLRMLATTVAAVPQIRSSAAKGSPPRAKVAP